VEPGLQIMTGTVITDRQYFQEFQNDLGSVNYYVLTDLSPICLTLNHHSKRNSFLKLVVLSF
jgi:hypothetical protein